MERKLGWPYKKEFACHRCGNCCRGDGFVDITESDLARAALFLEITEDEFLKEYCKPGNEFPRALLDQGDDEKSCIFLTMDEQGLSGCRIHKAKPTQCAGFPFQWRPKNIVQFCEGMRAVQGLPKLNVKRGMS